MGDKTHEPRRITRVRLAGLTPSLHNARQTCLRCITRYLAKWYASNGLVPECIHTNHLDRTFPSHRSSQFHPGAMPSRVTKNGRAVMG
jgi:hypothetical protein